MDRQLLVAHLEVDEEPMEFATVHLESLNSERLRKSQLDTIFSVLNRPGAAPSSMLVGDFNFSDGWPEQQHIAPTYLDVWRALHPDHPGYTMPPSPDGQFPAWRPDRILVKSPHFHAVTITIIGTQSLEGPCSECADRGRPLCTPSDHWGLVAIVGLGDADPH